MRIASSALSMTSQHAQAESFSQSEQLQLWAGAPAASSSAASDSGREYVLDLSAKASALLNAMNLPPVQCSGDQQTIWQLSDEDKLKIDLIEKFIEILTGKKVKLIVPEDLKIGAEKLPKAPAGASSGNPGSASADPGWGLRYSYQAIYKESEAMSFSATGFIATKDGRMLNISLALNLNRSYVSEKNIQILAGNASSDPLVINFGAASAVLTKTKFAFDLDADGQAERISFPTSGSGFLALDKNSDGIINDGRELFGPQSGDAFQELAAYDQDGNGWIDENDPIFAQLRIWSKDDSGKDILLVLGQTGIGAIYLGNIATAFALKTAENRQLGRIACTGLFVREDGTAGTVQHIDLAV